MPKDITYEVNDFRLRTAIPEPDSLALVRISVKINELRSRAEHNNQLNKN